MVFRRLEVLIKSFVEESSSQTHILFLTVSTSELINLTFFVFVFVVGISVG
jgi:hypothetical protein